MAFALTLTAFAVLASAVSVVWYCVVFPRHSSLQPLPELDAAGRHIESRLSEHVHAIASGPRNLAYDEALNAAAHYIEATLTGLGLSPNSQEFTVAGRTVRNIEVCFEPHLGGTDAPVLILGAHYDTDGNSPGAHDNATGVAAALEIARLLDTWTPEHNRLCLVFWVNEEHPYGKTPDMGSWQHAKRLNENGTPVLGAIALETLGYFSDAPGSQRFPKPFDLVYNDTGNFIAFVALPGSRSFLGRVTHAFRRASVFPSIGGLAPGFIRGVDLSDHWSYHQFGFPALMVTDTAPYRNPYYHSTGDLPGTVDYRSLAHITLGLEKVVRQLMK